MTYYLYRLNAINCMLNTVCLKKFINSKTKIIYVYLFCRDYFKDSTHMMCLIKSYLYSICEYSKCVYFLNLVICKKLLQNYMIIIHTLCKFILI